ncbi:MAG: hypothetical protein MjAS7_1058 [Metallosphaera javensis (ex Sakai et al. 2022)]|nr:MAG: hypothetical protein MjAS7_1058 [Metallosphaera javensis (ex Sakai et al. 2022)]
MDKNFHKVLTEFQPGVYTVQLVDYFNQSLLAYFTVG